MEENEDWEKDVYYIIEYWTDEYGTLAQAIKYMANDSVSKKMAIDQLNPNMTKIKSKTYYNIRNEVLKVETF